MSNTARNLSVGLIVFMLVIAIVYGIVLYVLYQNQSYIFSVYVPPDPPSNQNAYYPLGSVTPLTAEEIQNRNDIIMASYG